MFSFSTFFLTKPTMYTALIQPLSAIFTSPVMNKNSKNVVKTYRGHENIVALKGGHLIIQACTHSS